ncbi:transposase [Propionicimonas sp.]|uniref:RNA-guided endonuclease InsQ/TnpB family protein n=1 Tax=Propionicimonas sp. TaxID=1955623 RepID=UPI0017AD2C6F|nr:transposase [Propionicimonas sp.]MBA3019650.1 IS200/IS605 family element transposase accessory protein TnpB [Propionicimonas sp.]MBU4208005.1 transposase [Actinomycetota bacterium]MBU4411457.1 transposase [Actinomycetota bacterium]MCG2805769.1 RNA-guided endonuclease TnpB family protein [Propionicimonas sp.]
MSNSRMRTRAYLLPSHANPGKEQRVRDLLPWWQRGLVHTQLIVVRRLREGIRPGYLDTRAFPGYLSQRQWKSVVNQVNAAIESWRELAVIAVRALICDLDVADEDRIALYQDNKAKRWFGHPVLGPMVERLLSTTLPFPHLATVRTMNMDGPIATHEVPANPNGPHQTWVRISGVPGTRPVRIPFGTNPYEQAAAGQRANYLQVHVPDHGPIVYRVIKHSPIAAPRSEGKVLGLDWGLANLFATSDGRRHGQQLYRWLRTADTQLTALAASLQRQGIRLSQSKRYRAMVRRLRRHVRNEVGRVLNKIATDNVAELVVEKLDFRGGGMSRRMNRILTIAGRAAVTAKVAALTEDHGITVTAVNPAHTSRQCSGCGYTTKTNRKTQDRFRCGFCGKGVHADINASRVILQRRSLAGRDQHMSKDAVLAHLDCQFATRWGCDPGRFRERQTRPHSRATRQDQPVLAGSTTNQTFVETVGSTDRGPEETPPE